MSGLPRVIDNMMIILAKGSVLGLKRVWHPGTWGPQHTGSYFHYPRIADVVIVLHSTRFSKLVIVCSPFSSLCDLCIVLRLGADATLFRLSKSLILVSLMRPVCELIEKRSSACLASHTLTSPHHHGVRYIWYGLQMIGFVGVHHFWKYFEK
jgi:hypothetical protein